MRSFAILGLIAVCGLLCAVAEAQQNYDGRNGPHVFGTPGNQVYIRGQNEGPYNVPGVGGTFQNSPGRGEHVYTDERGNTFVNNRHAAGGAGGHSISGPDLRAHRGGLGAGGPNGGSPLGPGGITASRADGRTVGIPARGRRGLVSQNSRNRRQTFSVGRPDRRVDFRTGPGGSDFVVQRGRRDTFSVGRPDRRVDFSTGPGGSDYLVQRGRRDTFSVGRPDRRVDFSTGPGGSDYVVQRGRRSPQRVVGDNFAARGGGAGAWKDNGVSIWRRTDGRTVTTDANGNVITSGSPNGRGPQHVSITDHDFRNATNSNTYSTLVKDLFREASHEDEGLEQEWVDNEELKAGAVLEDVAFVSAERNEVLLGLNCDTRDKTTKLFTVKGV